MKERRGLEDRERSQRGKREHVQERRPGGRPRAFCGPSLLCRMIASYAASQAGTMKCASRVMRRLIALLSGEHHLAAVQSIARGAYFSISTIILGLQGNCVRSRKRSSRVRRCCRLSPPQLAGQKTPCLNAAHWTFRQKSGKIIKFHESRFWGLCGCELQPARRQLVSVLLLIRNSTTGNTPWPSAHAGVKVSRWSRCWW